MKKENLNISYINQIYEISRKQCGKLGLCSIASPPLSEVATENFNVVAFVKIHKTEKNKDIASQHHLTKF